MKEYIEREAPLFNIAAKFEKHYGKSREQSIHDFYKFVIKKICAVPAADVVEVRHAKWDDVHKCTACGNEALLEEKPDTMAHGLNSLFFVDSDYCPHCGALMDKEEK